MARPGGLGRGLSALIPAGDSTKDDGGSGNDARLVDVAIDAIVPLAAGVESMDRAEAGALIAVFGDRLANIPLVTIDDTFGGWGKAQKLHFADGGVFDKIYQPGVR